jgi:hypothetical protein
MSERTSKPYPTVLRNKAPPLDEKREKKEFIQSSSHGFLVLQTIAFVVILRTSKFINAKELLSVTYHFEGVSLSFI